MLKNTRYDAKIKRNLAHLAHGCQHGLAVAILPLPLVGGEETSKSARESTLRTPILFNGPVQLLEGLRHTRRLSAKANEQIRYNGWQDVEELTLELQIRHST